MENSIKISNDRFQQVKFAAFVLYNLIYSFHMLVQNQMSRTLYLGTMFFFITLCILDYLYRTNWRICVFSDSMKRELFLSLFIVVVFLTISLGIQLFHSDFNSYILKELLYNIIPITLAFFWVNTCKEEERYTYFVVSLLRTILVFMMFNINNFSLDNVLKISWSDSSSSAFESVYAHDFFFLEVIFLYYKKPKAAIISMICCMLSFKRISFLFAGVVLVIYFIANRKKSLSIGLYTIKNVSLSLRILVIVFCLVTPFVVDWLVVGNGDVYLLEKFGFDVNEFSTGRIGIMKYVTANIDYFNGYGSSDYFLEHCKNIHYNKLGSMHCDYYKMYCETSFAGVVAFTFCFIEIIKKNLIIFLLGMYLIFELIMSHFFDTLGVWNMFYMFMAVVYGSAKNK